MDSKAIVESIRRSLPDSGVRARAERKDAIEKVIGRALLEADFLASVCQKKGCLEIEAIFRETEWVHYPIYVYVRTKDLSVSEPYIFRTDEEDEFALGMALVLFDKAPPAVQKEAMRLHDAMVAAFEPEPEPQPEEDEVAAPRM